MTCERIPLADSRFDMVTGMLRESYPNVCVLFVDQVKHEKLEEAFLQLKANRAPFVTERLLFHGTTQQAAESIIENGFDPEYNTASAYGKGTYFATHASYSKQYARANKYDINYMFVSRVIVGTGARLCNGRLCANAKLNVLKYDNFVDNIENPKIYVTPFRDGALPLYLVGFHANAV